MVKLRTKNLLKPMLGLVLIVGLIVIVMFDVGSTKPKTSTSSGPNLPCGAYRNDGNVVINGQRINVEIPKNPTEFEKGLGGRPCILPNQGMFFAFNSSGQYKFWMKDMQFPIDIIWINSTHRVAALEVNVQPSTYHSKNPFFVNDQEHLAQYVLELKANRSKQLHLNLGTPVAF